MMGAIVPLMMTSLPAHAQLIDIDLDLGALLGAGLCIGGGCNDDFESPNDELTLSGTDVSILFDDTSVAPAARNDWRIVINEPGSTGQDFFAINDVTGGQQPFRIMGGTPSNAFMLAASGNVGFGTQFPQRDLHVTATDSPSIRLEQTSGGPGAQVWDVVANEENFVIVDTTSAQVPYKIEAAAPTNSLVITETGNVGFGVGEPAEKLHILTTAPDTDSFALFDAQGSGSDSAFRIRQNGIIPTTWEFRNQQSSGRLNVGIAGGNTPFKIDNLANNNLLRLGSDTETDVVRVTGRLVVNDVTVAVPDYVFKDDYVLRPLAEVKAFIEENSHLPEVPSEKDIAAGGVDMTGMQMALLKKVEELTLYTLQQEEAISAQMARNDALRDRLAKVEAKLAE
ncbi:hypothetical protein BOO69_04750 [Sulfitobacter alexandrii]|uniref:Peptidase S74 domain-containing protein n=2 Tax=Sulfitobacter alexandrii TaxID=1917485 RepID=A0A1J0WF83_9RHOB|nr:hypothetical protein BOO69_04750 [Sulfitobacter alexandrii]